MRLGAYSWPRKTRRGGNKKYPIRLGACNGLTRNGVGYRDARVARMTRKTAR